MEENEPSRGGGERGEKGRFGRYEYAEDVSGRFRYLHQLQTPLRQRNYAQPLDQRRLIGQLYPIQQLGPYRAILAQDLELLLLVAAVHSPEGHEVEPDLDLLSLCLPLCFAREDHPLVLGAGP